MVVRTGIGVEQIEGQAQHPRQVEVGQKKKALLAIPFPSSSSQFKPSQFSPSSALSLRARLPFRIFTFRWLLIEALHIGEFACLINVI